MPARPSGPRAPLRSPTTRGSRYPWYAADGPLNVAVDPFADQPPLPGGGSAPSSASTVSPSSALPSPLTSVAARQRDLHARTHAGLGHAHGAYDGERALGYGGGLPPFASSGPRRASTAVDLPSAAPAGPRRASTVEFSAFSSILSSAASDSSADSYSFMSFPEADTVAVPNPTIVLAPTGRAHSPPTLGTRLPMPTTAVSPSTATAERRTVGGAVSPATAAFLAPFGRPTGPCACSICARQHRSTGAASA